GVDDLDHDRQILGEAKDLGRVEDAVRAEPRDTVKDGGARKVLRAKALDQRRCERAMVPLVALTDEDTHENLFAREDTHSEGPPIYCLTAREAPDERSSRESNDSGSEADQDRRGDIA